MTWHVLANSQTADASDMNDNFDHVVAGSRLPMSSVGVSFANTDSAYNIGSGSYRWDNVYCNDLDLSSAISTTSRSLFFLESEVLVTIATSEIEFSGLNGDDTTEYILYCKFVSASSASYSFRYNDDTTGSYGIQRIYATGAIISSDRITSNTSIYLGAAQETYPNNFSKTVIYSKTGHERTSLSDIMMQAGGSYIYILANVAAVWSNTSDTITSIQIRGSGSGICEGSHIQLWRRA